MSAIIETAKTLALVGVATIAVGDDKRPLANWREYQVRVPNPAEIERTMRSASSLAIVAGKVLCIDVDEKVDPTKTIFARYKARCEEAGLGELWNRAVIQRTKNGGFHIVFRCDDESVRNEKLAQRENRECLIETRGSGGYFVAHPSPGYTLVQGDFAALQTFTAEERDALLDAARSLTEQAPQEAHVPKVAVSPVSKVGGDLTPGDDFDARGDMPNLLRAHGWKSIRESKLWTRPGKNSGISASWNHIPGRFYVFTSSTAFEPMHTYRPWHVFAVLECGGDFAEAARKLRLLGYGGKSERRDPPGMQLGAREETPVGGVEGSAPEAQQPIRIGGAPKIERKPLPQILSFDDEELSDWPKPPELIHGLLYQGAKGMLAGPSKARKTYLLTDLAISVAGGVPWLGFATTQKPTLYLNLELQPFAFRDRRRAIASAKLADARVPNLFSMHGRGHSLSWDDLFVGLPDFCKKEGIGLLVVDPVYKLNQGSGDENKAGDVGRWLNGLEALAGEANAAIVFAHHFAKGDSSSKASIDRMSGSGVWARDPDALISFTPHKEEGCMTFEASLRNFAPQDPFVVRWNHPIWERDVTLNASELKDSGNKGGRPGLDLNLFLRALEKHGGTLTRANQDEVADIMGCGTRALWTAWKKLKETAK